MNVAGQNFADKTSDSVDTEEKTAGQKFVNLILSILPWAIVGSLLYAGLFVKPTATIEEVIPPAIDKRDNIMGIARISSDVYWAAGNYGKILITKDKGKTWVNQVTPIDTHIQDIDSWDDKRAVAVGNKGKVVVTSDGGETWREVEAPLSEVSNKLMRVHTYEGGEALSVGEAGMVIQSTDYGETWHSLRPESDVYLNDIVRVDDQTIMIAAETNPETLIARIIISRDNGETWEEVYTESPNSFMAINFKSPLEGVAVGLAGVIVGTTDGGVTWTMIDPSQSGMTEHLMDVHWSEETNQWVSVGNKGKWMTFSADLTSFEPRNLSDKDFTSHSELTLDGKGFLSVGETVGYMDLDTKSWTIYAD
jgi:photosystem II stability/assembly factor-like uncharacterized protein